jgi:hypothetical protein
MTANMSKLRAWREGVSAGENCLPLEALERLAEGDSSDLKNSQHVAGCPHCQAELAMLKSFNSSLPSAKDEKAVEWVVAQLQGAKNVPSSSPRVPFWRALLRMPNLAMAAALTLAIGLGLSLYVSNRQERPVLHVTPTEIQNMRSGDIRLTDPSGELDRTPENFRWTALPQAKSYSVQLLEVDGTVLWSGQTEDNVLIASPELKSKIRPGKQLLWTVTALDASGKPIAQSSQGGFRVTLVKPR